MMTVGRNTVQAGLVGRGGYAYCPCSRAAPAAEWVCCAPGNPQPMDPAVVVVEFAASLRRHVPCEAQTVPPGSLREVLDAALRAVPGLTHYIYDDQRSVRKHVAVFVNKQMVLDRVNLAQPVRAGDRVLVVQALSGG